MRLIHFAAEPMAGVWPVPQISYRLGEFSPKPKGLWVSDEDEYGWREWCNDESFGEDRLEVAHEIELAPDANLLTIGSAEQIDWFTDRYGEHGKFQYWIDWPEVADDYQGIVITPYIASRRLARHTSWYYPWDCASGCIWDTDAIAGFTVVELAPMEADRG